MGRKAQKQKANPRLYLKNNWQLYAMLVVPVIYMVLFNYKPMLGVVVAFKKLVLVRKCVGNLFESVLWVI